VDLVAQVDLFSSIEAHRRNSSLLTRCWSERDSNRWSLPARPWPYESLGRPKSQHAQGITHRLDGCKPDRPCAIRARTRLRAGGGPEKVYACAATKQEVVDKTLDGAETSPGTGKGRLY
jgi:hypothetical protein